MWLTRACVNTESSCSLSALPPSKSNPVVYSSFRAIAGGGAGCGVIVASSLKKKKKTIGDSRPEACGVSSAGRVWWGIRRICSLISGLGSLSPTHGSGRGSGDRAGAVDVLELLDLCNAADRWTSLVCKWVPVRNKLFCCILKIFFFSYMHACVSLCGYVS